MAYTPKRYKPAFLPKLQGKLSFGQIIDVTTPDPNVLQSYSGDINGDPVLFPKLAVLNLINGSAFINSVANTSSVNLSVTGGQLTAVATFASGTPSQILYYDTTTGVVTSDSNFFRDNTAGGSFVLISSDIANTSSIQQATNRNLLTSVNGGLSSYLATQSDSGSEQAAVGILKSGVISEFSVRLSGGIPTAFIKNRNTVWRWPLTDGTIGQVIKTDGAGNLSFTSVTSGVSSVTGTTSRITTSPTTGAVVVDISATYTGQSSIITVGTLTTGAIGSGFTAIPNSALANSVLTINGFPVSLGGTITVTATASNALTIGSGLSGTSYNGSAPVTITNTLPDQTVVLASGTGISVTGTYPSFTITNTSPSSGGTITAIGITPANGVSGTSSGGTTPNLTITLGAIIPSTVNGITLSGSGSFANSGVSSLTVFTGSGTSSGTNTGDQTITLTSEATGSGTGSFAVTLTNSAVIGKVLTGYISGAGTVAATDTILQAIQKLNGNQVAAASPLTTKGDIYTFSTINARLAVGTTNGQILQVSSGSTTGLAWSTPTYPSASGTIGTILRSDGTNNVYTTATFANTYTASNILYSNGANTVIGLATANSSVLVTDGSGVPSLSTTIPNGVTATTQSSGDNSNKIATDAFVTTAINNAIAGVNPAVAVQAATTTVLPNSPTYLNGASGIGATLTAGVTNTTLVVDGYTPVLNDRILVKNQASAFQNGVYFVSQVAALGLAWTLTRALDYDQPSDINNTGAIPVVNGTANATTSWLLTSSVTTVGTDSLTYTQFSYNPSVIITTSTSAGGDLTGTYPNPTIKASVNLTGTPTVSTPALGDNSFTIADTAFVANNNIQKRKFGTTTFEIWYTQAITASGNTTASIGKDFVFYFPFEVTKACTVDRLGVEITGAGSVGAFVRLGIYLAANMLPTTLMVDANASSGSNIDAHSATFQSLTISTVLNPGMYFFTITHNSAVAPTFRCALITSLPAYLGYPSTGGASTAWTDMYVAKVYAALANPATTPTNLEIYTDPLIFFRLSA